MKIWTLWHRGDENDAPWIVDAVDEYTLENHGDFPPDYGTRRADPLIRELIIDVPEDKVRALFEAPAVQATVVSGDN